MQPAYFLSILTLWVNLSTAVSQFAISRAPGWRAARVFGVIALTAAAYSVSNLVYVTPGLPDSVYRFAARWSYLAASLHIIAWYPFAFGGPDARWSAMPRAMRPVLLAILAGAILFACTGWHVRPEIVVIEVPWARVGYHYALTTPAGDAYSVVFLLLLAVPFAQFVRRWRRGESDLGLVVLGFVLFMITAVIEVAVANRWLVTFSPAEFGFLAIVGPTALRSLRRFLDDAHRLGELSGRLAGEVRERTVERDRAESALAESERLAGLGRIAAGVGHEINNPLAYLQLALDHVDEHLGASAAPAEVRESLAHARDGAWRIQKVVEGLRAYSGRDEERRPLDPAAVARAALQVAHPHLRHVARVETELHAAPRVAGAEPRLVQALVNLLVNAAQAVSARAGAGRIALRLHAADGRVTFEVRDDGPGIAPETLAHLAEPYFTTRAGQGGLGLGLFLTRGIVDAHGGELRFESEPGRGTTVRLSLPALRAAEAPAPASGPAPPAPAPAAGPAERHVLVVDDEPLVLTFLVRALARHWQVTGVASGEEAEAKLAERAWDAVLCDLMMPGLTGMELAARVAARDPAQRARMLFLSGGAVTPEAQAFVARPDVTCIDKPIDLRALVALLDERLAATR